MSFNGTTLGFDISPLRDGINEANSLIKTNESYWRSHASTMTNWNKTSEGLQARNDMLNTQLTEQGKKVANQEQIVSEYIATFGEQSEATQKQIQILNSYKAELGRTQTEIAKNESKINDLSEAEKKAQKTTSELAKETEAQIAVRKQYQKAVEDTEKKIDDLINAEGDHSAEIADLRKQLAQERKALEEAGGAVEDLADETEEAESKTSTFSKALKGIAGGAKVAVAGLTTMAGAVAGAVGGMASIADETRESRGLFAKLENNAEMAGKSYEDLTEDLKNVVAVTGDLEAGMEGMNMLSNLEGTSEEISAVANALTGASAKFDGLKFETIAESLQESVAGTAGAVGGFAELIERSGGDLEAFNEGMAGCTTESERTQYAMKWLADSGLAEVSDSFRETNKDLVNARQAEIDLQLATNELGAVSEPVANKIKTLGASFISNLIPGLKGTVEAFSNVINGVAGADKDLVYNIGYLIGSAVGTVKNWWETAKPALAVMFGEVFPMLAGKLIAQIPGWIAGIAKSLYENAPTLISNLMDGIVSGLSEFSAEIENPVLKTLLDWLISGFQWISDNSQLVTDGLLLIAGAFAGFHIIKTIKGLVDTFRTSFTILNAVMSANPIGLVITAIAGLVAGFVLLYKNSETFRNFIDGLWAKVKEFGTNIYNWVTVDVPAWFSSVGAWFAQIPGYIKGKFDEGLAKVKEFGTSLITWATVDVPAWFTSVGAWFAKIPGYIKGKFDEALTKVKEFGTSLITWATVDVPAWFTSVGAWFAKIPGYIKGKFDEALTKVKEFGSNLTTFATVDVPAWFTSVGAWFAKIPGYIKGKFDEALTKVTEWGTSLKEKAGTAINGMLVKITTTLVSLPRKLKEKFDSALTKVTEWGTSLKEKGKTAIGDLITGITEKASNIAEDVKSIGTNIIEGIWNGIENAKDWLSEKIGSIFGSDGFIIKGIKKLLGIASPAKETKPLGDYFMQGFEAGLEGRTPKTVNIAQQETEKVLDAVSDTIDNADIPPVVISTTAESNTDTDTGSVSFVDTLAEGFKGFDQKIGDLLAGAFEGAISGDTSVITSALSKTGDFLVSGLQSVLSSAIPGLGGFIASAIGGIFSGIKSLFGNSEEKKKQQEELAEQISYAELLAQAQADAYNTTLQKAKQSIAKELGNDITTNIKAIVAPQEQIPQKVVNYTQINNSPKALSAKDIYRNNNRAINMIQQGVRA